MNDLTHIDLFSGIGGFALAAGWAGFRTEVFCEIDEFCQEVLREHWPTVPIISNVKNFKWPLADNDVRRFERTGLSKRPRRKRQRKAEPYRDGQITLLTGGFPCQPFSTSGRRRGAEDDRFLWPEMVRIVSEIRPTWVIAENVTGFINMELDRSISDLESAGYETEPYHIPACAVAAPHERLRVFLVGHSERMGLSGFNGRGAREKPTNGREDVSDNDCKRQKNKARSRTTPWSSRRGESCLQHWWDTEPDVGRVAYGVPNRVDRLKALGNAVVPQIAYEIIKAIAEIEGRTP